jgi:hypothetical protein
MACLPAPVITIMAGVINALPFPLVNVHHRFAIGVAHDISVIRLQRLANCGQVLADQIAGGIGLHQPRL